MSNSTDDGGHGDSPAAWAAVVIMLVGVAIATTALFLDVIPVVWLGAALIPVGLVIGGVLKAVGLGVGGHRATGGSH